MRFPKKFRRNRWGCRFTKIFADDEQIFSLIFTDGMADNTFVQYLQRVQTFVVENFLLVGFCGAVLIAFAYPLGGKLFYSWQAGDYRIIELLNNCFVFFISGLTLKVEDLKTVVKHKVPVLYSLITINFLTTLLSFGLIRIPYLIKDFAIGVTIFATVPTTLGVGVALTQLAKGDQILSLFLTVVSNLLGIVTVPFLLGIYLHESAIKVDPVKLTLKMAITVLAPTVLGMLTRRCISAVPAFTKKYKSQLSMLSTFNLVMIVWMALSTARNNLLEQNVGEVLYVLAIAILMHVFYLVLNAFLVSEYVLNFPRKQAVSVIIMASQKSSPVALAVITSLATETPQQKGLFALPCIIGQLSQIFIGSFIAGKLANWAEAPLAEELPAHEPSADEDVQGEEAGDVEMVSKEGGYAVTAGEEEVAI